MADESNVQPGSATMTPESRATAARAAAAKILGEPVADSNVTPDSNVSPPPDKTGTTTPPAPPQGQVGSGQFRPSQKQTDAAKELGLTDEQIVKMTEQEAKAYEHARSVSSKAQGKQARRIEKLEKQIAALAASPNREQPETAGASAAQVTFAPPDDATLTELFGSKDSQPARQYIAALEKAHKVDALETRLNAMESGAANERASQGQRTVDGFFDGLDAALYPEFGKTTDLEEDGDEEAARVKLCKIAQRLSGGEDGMTLDESLKAALAIVRPDALKRQAQDELRKQIEDADKRRIGTPSQRAIPREPSAGALTPEQRADAARADARARHIPID